MTVTPRMFLLALYKYTSVCMQLDMSIFKLWIIWNIQCCIRFQGLPATLPSFRLPDLFDPILGNSLVIFSVHKFGFQCIIHVSKCQCLYLIDISVLVIVETLRFLSWNMKRTSSNNEIVNFLWIFFYAIWYLCKTAFMHYKYHWYLCKTEKLYLCETEKCISTAFLIKAG